MEQAAPLARMLDALELRGDDGDREEILNRFLEYVGELGLDPYPAQEEAILELLSWKHVILNTPTGSGKSLVALALHFQAMAEERVSFYTAPTKALVNEKFFALCDAFGPHKVGLLTGDAAVNRQAPIICCTAEILSNMALREDDVGIEYVIMDEFHFYGDRDRGVAWQIPLIAMKDTLFLLMSATLGDTKALEDQLHQFTQREVAPVRGSQRPVPLKFSYQETLVHETVESLLDAGEAPIYLVNFTQKSCAEQAQNLTSLNVASKEDKRSIAQELEGMTFDTPYGKEFQRFVRNGLAVHHAGLLPKYRRVVERLAQRGLIKVISGTDTLGVGVNIPIRSVLLRQLYKYDGEKNRLLSARQFHQIAGRAGRKGFDDHGQVVVQAPEWVIENRRLEQKIRARPHLKKKIVKKRPPQGAIAWDEKTFNRLIGSAPEPLTAQFQIGTGMVVNLLQEGIDRKGGGYRRLIDLIDRSHGHEGRKKHHRRRAAALVRSLRQAGIVEVLHGEGGGPSTMTVRSGLQHDFSLHHTLSLYVVRTLNLIDRETETYAAEALTLVESVLEDPKVILFRQLDRIKGELVGRLKAEGMDYTERMAELEKVDYPKPNAEFIYETFEAFVATHPWVGAENIRPKSIAREMYEQCLDFNGYVLLCGLARSEGVLLRYLMQTYKTAVQTVPEELWNEDFEDILAFLHGVVRRTDSSLVQEWRLLVTDPEGMRNADRLDDDDDQQEHPWDIAANGKAFRARVRNELHVVLKALADGNYEKACSSLRPSPDDIWTPERLAEEMAPLYEDYESIDVTPRARQAHNTFLREETPHRWKAQQKILDPEGHDEWVLDCIIDLTRPWSESSEEPLLELQRIGS